MVIRPPNYVPPKESTETIAEPAPVQPSAPIRPAIIDKTYILSIPSHQIFATGKARDTELRIGISHTGKPWKWIAVKGGGADWAIYCSPDYRTDERIHGLGEKVHDKDVIKLLVKCDDSALEIYRH